MVIGNNWPTHMGLKICALLKNIRYSYSVVASVVMSLRDITFAAVFSPSFLEQRKSRNLTWRMT